MADLVNPYGQVVSVPDDQVEQAFAEGFTPATAGEVEQRAQEVEYGGWTGAGASVGLGALSGATLGLSDVALRSAGAGDALQGYAAVNPELHTAGQIAGSLIGPKVPLAPARLAVRAGQGLTRALGGGRLAAAAGMAAEWALYGVGSGISELAREDSEQTGEQIAAVLLRSAGSGAAFGAGFGLGGAALSRAAKRAASIGNEGASALLAAESSASRRILGEAAESGTSRLAGAWDNVSSALGVSKAGTVKRLLEKARDGRRGIEVAQNWQEHATKAATTMVDDLQRLLPKAKAPGVSETRRLLTDTADDLARSMPEAAEAAEVAIQRSASDIAERVAPNAAPEVAQQVRAAVRSQLDETLNAVRLRDDLAQLGKRGDLATVAGGVVGGLGGGPAGMAMGAVLGAAVHPGSALRKIATVDSLLSSFAGSAGGGVRSFFRGAGKSAAVAPRIASGIVGRREPRVRYTKSIRQAQSLVARAPAVEQQVSHALAPVASVAPVAARTAATKVLDVSRFLAGKAPADVDESGHSASPSLTEIASYLRSEEVATNPLRAVDLLKSGDLSTEHVEALRELWPGVYNDIRQTALDEMVTMAADGKQLPYRERLRLGVLLDIETDPTLSPQVLTLLQSGYSAPATGGPSTGAPSQTSRIPRLSEAYAEEVV